MDSILREDLKKLIEAKPGSKVSIYLPTHRVTAETDQDRIRLKNALDTAEQQLLQADLRRPEAQELLAQASGLLDDDGFWRSQSDGLALFLSEEGMGRYRLPREFSEFVAVSDSFHIKPLIPLVGRNGRFYILALSLSEIRLLQANEYSADDLQVEQMPESIGEALRYDDPEQRLQFHTTTETPSGRGDRAAQFYGHGVGTKDEKKDRILRFFQQVAEDVHEVIGEEYAPMVLAGVDYLLPIFRQASEYSHVMEEGIHGNPEQLSEAELHARAWEIVAPRLQAARDRAEEEYHALKEGPRASNEIGEILSAGHRRLIDSLFVSQDDRLWGAYDIERDEIDIQDGPDGVNVDLLDLAAARTIAAGGEVFALSVDEIPDGEKIAAVFRDGME